MRCPRPSLLVLLVCAAVPAAASRALAADPPVGVRVFVSNSGDGDVSIVDPVTRVQAAPDAVVGSQPYWVVGSPDGRRVYVANRNGAVATMDAAKPPFRAAPGSLPPSTPSVSVIDALTGEVIDEIPLSKAGATGLAVTPDGARLYVTCTHDDAVAVVDTATGAEIATIDLAVSLGELPTVTVEAIVASPDGTTVFVLDRGMNRVVRIAVATNAQSGPEFPVAAGHRDLGISGDGSRLILVGDNETEILDAATGARTALLPDIGSHRHVAVSGNRAVVSNQAYLDPLPPSAKPADGQSSLDVYDLATSSYVDSVPLSATNAYGVAIAPDGTYAWVTSKNDGVLMSVDLVDRVESAPTAPIGNTSRNAAAVTLPREELVDAFMLPRRLKVRARGSGTDFFKAAGTFDPGSGVFDESKPVTLSVGGFSRTFQLVRKGKSLVSPKDPGLSFRVRPNRQGSGRGGFQLIIRKIALDGLIATDGEVPFVFVGPEGDEARGTIVAKGGKYTLGRVRGALEAPVFFPAKIVANLKEGAKDKLSVRAGFATDGPAPTALDPVRIEFGSYARTIARGAFRRSGAKFTFQERTPSSKLKVVLDFARDEATVVASGIELGPLDGDTADLVLGNGAADAAFRVRVRLGGTPARRIY